jgi:hypothetical protein
MRREGPIANADSTIDSDLDSDLDRDCDPVQRG